MKAVAVFLLGLCCLAISHAWTCEDAPQLSNVKQIDAGQGKVVAVDTDGPSWFLSGSTWQKMSSAPRFKHVSVGRAGLWASDYENRVYKFIGGNFVKAAGLSMEQVDAGSDQLVGVGSGNTKTSCLESSKTSRYTGADTLTSTELPRALKYYSCGPLFGCWGVESGANKIYVTKNMNSATCDTSGWTHVSGRLAMVEVGSDGTVFGVNREGYVFQRTGISSGVHEGTGWSHIPMETARHVTYDLGYLWVVTTSGVLRKCMA